MTIFSFTAETVSAMAFGRLGQEDHVLVLITVGKKRFPIIISRLIMRIFNISLY